MANEKDANVEFSSYEIDAVGEILNISMGSAATAVSELLNAKVWITTPQVSVVKAADLNYDRLEPAICVKIVFRYFRSEHDGPQAGRCSAYS